MRLRGTTSAGISVASPAPGSSTTCTCTSSRVGPATRTSCRCSRTSRCCPSTSRTHAGNCTRPGRARPSGCDTRAVLCAQVCEVRLRVDRRPSRPPERFLRRELAPQAVDMLAEPLAHGGELTALDLLLEVRHVLEHLLPDLYGHDRAEQVRREVADAPGRPVRVLQDSLGVVRHLDAEVLVHLLVPHLRQVAHRDAAVDEILLELEAKDHMHAVGDLVGLDANQRRVDAVDPGEEAVELDAAQLLWERRLRARVEELPERGAPPDEVLPHPALRLVDAERARAADRQALEMAWQLMRVETVAVLVHRREERLHRLRVVVRRDPDVVRSEER